jgi:hypothetical protein
MNPNWGHPMSAVQIDAYDYAITGVTINVDDNAILDSPYSVFELVSGDGTGLPINGLNTSKRSLSTGLERWCSRPRRPVRPTWPE